MLLSNTKELTTNISNNMCKTPDNYTDSKKKKKTNPKDYILHNPIFKTFLR